MEKNIVHVPRNCNDGKGSAIEVLVTVPEAEVDIMGKVKLRGSTQFKVLIDDRPTLGSNDDVLLKVPVKEIDKIEIITNPSVNYDPDDVTGIVNIITRKNRLEGVSFIDRLLMSPFMEIHVICRLAIEIPGPVFQGVSVILIVCETRKKYKTAV